MLSETSSYDALISSAIKAPKFLKETKYAVPKSPHDTFVQYANQTRLPVFEYLQSIPSMMRDFNLFMGNTMGDRQYWHEWYDVKGQLLAGFDQLRSPIILVDVGGGKGHDLQAFQEAFGDWSWQDQTRLILQDLPPVLEEIPENALSKNVLKMSHDFFTEQPVKGKSTIEDFVRHIFIHLMFEAARCYFLHHILHDWSDEYCLKILKHLYQAMLPGYSKILIHELVLPNVGAAEIQARFDLVMMTLNGGMERSKSQWFNLLEDAGFVNIRIYEHLDHDGIIEAEVPIA